MSDPSSLASQPERFHGDAIAMGQIGVARHDGVLRTFLGSCVGLALHDRRRRIAGLAHIILPESRGPAHPPGKYADTAIREMLRLLRVLAEGEPLQCTAKLAGGATMFGFQSGMTIGDQNVLAVERLLATEGIPILSRCCGGTHGRRMSVSVATGVVTIQTVGVLTATIL